jgi:hypothetical protein
MSVNYLLPDTPEILESFDLIATRRKWAAFVVCKNDAPSLKSFGRQGETGHSAVTE